MKLMRLQYQLVHISNGVLFLFFGCCCCYLLILRETPILLPVSSLMVLIDNDENEVFCYSFSAIM